MPELWKRLADASGIVSANAENDRDLWVAALLLEASEALYTLPTPETPNE